MSGEVETENKVLVIRRIHVKYRLEAGDADRGTIERVHEMHRQSCPLYRTLHSAIDITTTLDMEG